MIERLGLLVFVGLVVAGLCGCDASSSQPSPPKGSTTERLPPEVIGDPPSVPPKSNAPRRP